MLEMSQRHPGLHALGDDPLQEMLEVYFLTVFGVAEPPAPPPDPTPPPSDPVFPGGPGIGIESTDRCEPELGDLCRRIADVTMTGAFALAIGQHFAIGLRCGVNPWCRAGQATLIVAESAIIIALRMHAGVYCIAQHGPAWCTPEPPPDSGGDDDWPCEWNHPPNCPEEPDE